MPRHIAIAYIDLLTCLLAVFFCFFIMMDDSPQAKGNVQDAARFIFEGTWSKDSASDVDIWLQQPDGSVTNYQKKVQGSVTLDVDDMGTMKVDVLRREVISVRSLTPGHYVANVMLYGRHDTAPPRVRLSLTSLMPYRVVAEQEVELSRSGDEFTLVSFDVDSTGKVSSVDTSTQVSLAKGMIK
jgi:hypothetical protein